MWEKIKTAVRWVYDWITVLTASLIGIPSILLEILNALSGIDIAPFVGPDKALKIVTGVAIVKALLALIETRMRA